MRRYPPQPQQGENQQQSAQTQQFPNTGQQFPPEQTDTPIRRPGVNFPHAMGPPQPQPQQQPTPAQPNSTRPAVQPPAQQTPQAPYGRALEPANPPRVSYAGGELTVTADNSSLSDILNAVVQATGAHLEGTRPPDSDRVFGTFGPGHARDVLNSLLDGSRFDYILVGAVDQPEKIQEIMLSPHGSSAGATLAGARPTTPEPAQEEETEVAPPMPEPPPPPIQGSPPEQQQNPPAVQQQVKTPEQLLQELQRLREQQQQQQNANPH